MKLGGYDENWLRHASADKLLHDLRRMRKETNAELHHAAMGSTDPRVRALQLKCTSLTEVIKLVSYKEIEED